MQITTKKYPAALASLSLGDYDPKQVYKADSVVTYCGYYYVALKNAFNCPPSPGGGDTWAALRDRDGHMVRKEEIAA